MIRGNEDQHIAKKQCTSIPHVFKEFQCQSCYHTDSEIRGVPPSNVSTRTEFSDDTWRCIAVLCNNCNNWRIQCRNCSVNDYSSTSKDGAYSNNYRRFINKHICSTKDDVESGENKVGHHNFSSSGCDVHFGDSNHDNEFMSYDDDGNTSNSTPSFEQVMFSTNTVSYNYFFDNINSPQGGVRGIIQRAISNQPPSRMRLPNADMASLSVTKMILSIFDVLMRVSGKLKLAVIMTFIGIVSYIAHGLPQGTTMPWFPASVDELKRLCISKQPKSIWGQIPSEEVVVLGDSEHVAISIDELIDHIMAFGAPIAWIQDDKGNKDNPHANVGINKSPAAKDMLERCRKIVQESGVRNPDETCFAYVVPWSDAFITAWVKQKDNSAWCQTITVAPPNDNDRSEYHTHCIALGPKNGDHSIVMDYLLKDLESIRKGKWRYYAHENRMVYTSFDLIAYLGDRPERSDMCQVLDHSGKTAKRSKFVAITDPDLLPSCESCYQEVLRQAMNGVDMMKDDEDCDDCCNFNYASKSKAWERAGRISDSYGNKFPTAFSNSGLAIPDRRDLPMKSLLPCEQTFPMLEQGAMVTLYELTYNYRGDGNWNSETAGNYMNAMGIRGNLVTDIKAEANRRRSLFKSSTLCERDLIRNYETAEKTLFPSIWLSGYDFDIFLDCPMHLLFLGIIGSILDDVFHIFLTSVSKAAPFYNHINKFLVDIISFRLSYCVTKKFGKSGKANWVSEHHVGAARVLPFIVGQFFLNFEDIAEKAPDKTLWIQRLINSAFVMISLLMSSQPVPTKMLLAHIKVFLNCCYRLGKLLTPTGTAFWENKGNYYSLLNLPQQIKRFGSLRLYWDGNKEHSIQHIKPELKLMRKTVGYLKRKLINIRKKEAFKRVKENFHVDFKPDDFTSRLDEQLVRLSAEYEANDQVLDDSDDEYNNDDNHRSVSHSHNNNNDDDDDDDDNNESSDWFNGYYRYQSVEEIQHRLNNGAIISGVLSKSDPDIVNVAYGKDRKRVQFIKVTRDISNNDECCGLFYCVMQCQGGQESTSISVPKDQFNKDIDGFCLLLPHSKKRGTTFDRKFGLVTNNWTVLKQTGLIGWPELSKRLFPFTDN